MPLLLTQRNIKLPGGCHKGELTKLGQQQARDVGEWLRQRYVQDLSFLPAQYEVNCTVSPTICITLSLPMHHATCVTFRGRYISNPAAACTKCSLHGCVAKMQCATCNMQHATCTGGFVNCSTVLKELICWQDGAVSGRTTNFSRTIATLQGVLTGLYPEAAQPIPVATASDMDEIMFANVLSCERLADVMKRARYELRGKALPMMFMLLLSRHWPRP